ncbi:MAG TPA: hypothetical protein VEQ40_05560, partial [Pyrinomonadaceae bacterium]|nr:hypothetical protein [Pyrinomonadaceae bacterium]
RRRQGFHGKTQTHLAGQVMYDETFKTQETQRRKDAEARRQRKSDGLRYHDAFLRCVFASAHQRVSARPRLRVLSLWLALFFIASSSSFVARAQDNESPWKSGSPPAVQARPRVVPDEGDIVERAIGAVCAERASDPLGSVPIDVMQARPSLPINHPDALAGARRAERLLPVAKGLVVEALEQLAREYNIDERKIRLASLRVKAVNKIEPDVELRDNASVILSTPRVIYFGTIFLAGLPSDEGMVSVLAHELTHIADGKEDALQALFRLVGRRAASLTNLRIYGRRPEELTCDLVGAMSARSLITRTPNNEKLPRRLARAVEHNCVEEDDTDEAHLSPRNTMRALLALDPTLARDIVGDRDLAAVPLPTPLRQYALSPTR